MANDTIHASPFSRFYWAYSIAALVLLAVCGPAAAQRYAIPRYADAGDPFGPVNPAIATVDPNATPGEALSDADALEAGTEPQLTGPEAAVVAQLLQRYSVLAQLQRTPGEILKAKATLAEPRPAPKKAAGPAGKTPSKTAPGDVGPAPSSTTPPSLPPSIAPGATPPIVQPVLPAMPADFPPTFAPGDAPIMMAPSGMPVIAMPMPGGTSPDGGPPGQDGEIQQFRLQVITGDWPAVEKHIAGLPKGAGPKVYQLLLTALANQRQAAVLPDEVVALADIAPSELDDRSATRLGQILGQSKQLVGEPKDTLARVRAGTKRLGGTDPKKRSATVRLLLAAGMIDEARSYLPPPSQTAASKDPAMLNLQAAAFMALGRRDRSVAALQQAWDFSELVLSLPQAPPAAALESRRRLVSLMAQMPEEPVVAWLQKTFAEQPVRGMTLLADAARKAETAFSTLPPPLRIEALSAQQRLFRGLAAAAAKDRARWTDALRWTALGWINEATFTLEGASQAIDVSQLSPEDRAALGMPGPTIASSPMPFTSSYVQPSETIAMPRRRGPQGNEIKPLPMKDLVRLSPSEAWCQAIDADTAWQIRRLSGKAAAMSGDKARAFAAITQFVQRNPAAARGLAEDFLRYWSARAAGRPEDVSDDEQQQMLMQQAMMARSRRYGGMLGPYATMPGMPGNTPAGGVPLARARQVRNLAALRDLLGEFRKLQVTIDQRELVSAIEACHSPAEVYREEDLKVVLGDLDALPSPTAVQLAASLRMKLAEQWRKPEIQEQMGTQRTDKDQTAEVVRGYQMAMRMVDASVGRDAKNVELLSLSATLSFDASEFLYGQKADLKTYVGLRERAFAGYRQAAAAYAEKAAGPPEKQSAEVYRQWFQSALGASDLAYLTRQDKPDADQIDRIRASIQGLGASADRHVQLFGEAVTASIPQVPAPLKPSYVRQAARVLGDHPAGRQIREKAAYYDDLVEEVRLHAAVDGADRVGHGQPFGLLLSMRYSQAMGRESGNFLHLLQKGYSPYSGQEADYPKQIEQALGEKLASSFEVVSVRFQDTKTTPRGFGRPGWLETPLAYAVLKAKAPSTDRIPPVQIDLDFNDGAGSVRLPIASQVVLVDAREALPPARPVQELAIRQVLDDRRIASGEVRLDIVATGKGLISDVGRLVDLSPEAVPGFRVGKVADYGLEIKSLESGDVIAPVSERRWQVELQPDGDEPAASFAFPRALDAKAKTTYQRYAEADIVDAQAVVPLQSTWARPMRWTAIILAVAGVFAAGGVGALAWRRRAKRRQSTQRVVYRRPEPLTPFGLVTLLERIAADPEVQLLQADRERLSETIDELNRQYFGRPPETAIPCDLTAVLEPWLHLANAGASRFARANL